jgi:kynureninase
MATVVQNGSATVALLKVKGIIVGHDMAHTAGRIQLLFNKDEPFACAFQHELLARL